MNISVIGTGYVGLVTGACLAESGNNVICVDNDTTKIEKLNDGILPIYEPGLPQIVERNVADERLSFSTDLAAAVRDSFIVFVTVGTPPAANGAADLGAVREVASAIGRAMDRYKLIVVKSTVPVGTAGQVRALVQGETTCAFDVVSNPEFLKQGAAVDDFMKPDRVVIGADDVRAGEVLRNVYAPFVRTGSPVLIMDIATAELVKYASNAFLASRISFMNEIANLAEHVGADIEWIRRGLSTDSRIGSAFLFAGVGFGGSCFPKDTRALIQSGCDHGYDMKILKAVDEVNRAQPLRFVERVRRHYENALVGKRLGVWGLAFKPRTNDMRDAPSIVIIERLLAEGASIVAYDPEAMDEAGKIFGSRIRYAKDNYACLEGADGLLLVTEWPVFRNPNFSRMRSMMREPVIFDGRSIYEPARLGELGFDYYGVGRIGSIEQAAVADTAMRAAG